MLAPEIQAGQKEKSAAMETMMKQFNHLTKNFNRPVTRFVVCSVCEQYLSSIRVGIKSHFDAHIRRNQATVVDKEKFLIENNIWKTR